MQELTKSRPRTIHSYIATAAERARRENTWVLVLNSAGPKGPMNEREDFEEAKKTCPRRYQESGQAHHRRHPREQVRPRPDEPFAWQDECSERVNPKTAWKWYDTQPAASSSYSRWQPSAWWQRHQIEVSDNNLLSQIKIWR